MRKAFHKGCHPLKRTIIAIIAYTTFALKMNDSRFFCFFVNMIIMEAHILEFWNSKNALYKNHFAINFPSNTNEGC